MTANEAYSTPSAAVLQMLLQIGGSATILLPDLSMITGPDKAMMEVGGVKVKRSRRGGNVGIL